MKDTYKIIQKANDKFIVEITEENKEPRDYLITYSSQARAQNCIDDLIEARQKDIDRKLMKPKVVSIRTHEYDPSTLIFSKRST